MEASPCYRPIVLVHWLESAVNAQHCRLYACVSLCEGIMAWLPIVTSLLLHDLVMLSLLDYFQSTFVADYLSFIQ